MTKPYVTAVITAAGLGKRFNGDSDDDGTPKQFINLFGVPILYHTVEAFSKMECVDEIVVSLPPGYADFEMPFAKVRAVAVGGADRQASVYEALCLVSKETDIVLIHDGVRPFVTERISLDIISQVKLSGAAVAGVKATDTIKETGADGMVVGTKDRTNLWNAQTPQGFTYEIIMKAHEMARREGFVGTDDSQLVERYGLANVKMIEGDRKNIKITTKDDLRIAEVYIKNL